MAQVAVMPDTSKHVQGASILQKACCLTLECHYLGNYRSVELESVVRAATGRKNDRVKDELAEAVRSNKHLVDPKALRKGHSLISLAKSHLASKAIRASNVFGDRSYLIPFASVRATDEFLTELSKEIQAENLVIAARWPKLVAEQAVILGPLFDAKQYPTQKDVETAFSIDWSYVSFSTPENLEHVDRALFADAQKKFERKMSEAFVEVRMVLRASLREFLARFADKMKPDADGKPKVFRNSVLDEITDFLNSFDVRNLTDDKELAAVVAQVRKLTKTLDPEQLREMETVRKNALISAEKAVAAIDGLISKSRGRGLALGGI